MKKHEMMYEQNGVKARKQGRVRNWLRRRAVRAGIRQRDFSRRHQHNDGPPHGLCGK